jgi:opacity protein-like surface antigen
MIRASYNIVAITFKSVHFIIKLTLTLTLCFSLVATARAGDSYQSYESYHRQNSDFSSYEPKQSELPFDSDYTEGLDNNYKYYSRTSVSRYTFNKVRFVAKGFESYKTYVSPADSIAFEKALGYKINNNFRLEWQTEYIDSDDGKVRSFDGLEYKTDTGSIATSINLLYDVRPFDSFGFYFGGGGGFSQVSFSSDDVIKLYVDNEGNEQSVKLSLMDEVTHLQYIIGGKVNITARSSIDFAYQHREIGDLDFGDLKVKDMQAKSFRIGYSVDF